MKLSMFALVALIPLTRASCCSGLAECNDPAINACVCAFDPYCCTTSFDLQCVEEAKDRCGLNCGDCVPQNGDNGQVCSGVPARASDPCLHGEYVSEIESLFPDFADRPKTCHCFDTCWEGDRCDEPIPVDDPACVVAPIDPEMLFQMDWMKRHPSIITTIYPTFANEYNTLTRPLNKPNDALNLALSNSITAVHAAAGNAKTDGYQIVVGLGAHQILSAAIHALSNDGHKHVFAQKPHWARFVPISENANTKNATWTPEASADMNSKNVIEIHTLPNNPDNKYHPAAFPEARVITDRVYYWPNQQKPEQIALAEDDIMVFSLSKLTSHPATRFGWALVKDPDVAKRMASVISGVVQSIPMETVTRTIRFLQAVNKSVGTNDDFFVTGRQILEERFDRLTALFAPHSTHQVISDFGVFFMVACTGGVDEDVCQAQFTLHGIKTRLGSRYGYLESDGIIMMALGNHDVTFEALYTKLTALLDSQETPAEKRQKEWQEMSQGGTRRVFNFAIGSLLSHGGTQYTLDKTMPENPPLVHTIVPAFGQGVMREFTYCWRYVAVAARPCTFNDPCPPIFGAVFEITHEDWDRFRSRESDYDILPVEIVGGDSVPEGAYTFTWGAVIQPGGVSKTCADPKYPPPISQAYWDFMIGGILAWDGQLMPTQRYTWDIVSEKAEDFDMATRVAVMPSLTLESRLEYAGFLINSTGNPYEYPWKNDRACPYTANSLVTPKNMLQYPTATIDSIAAPAIGTAGSFASNQFYDLVDGIMEQAGLDLADRSPMDCSESGFIDRSEWTRNPYWDDIQTWLTQQ